ncbi:hypothetical protein EDC62_2514 [Tibeticola sediminis]|uniref:Uncharacterized protein n=1 Tax=Tibeticola sediminis TaxID=1917811 RepID=A0A3N4U7W1_9BURK|nr:hypothetical protein EDC62_2514 [Tibeticola sediminis]
MPALTPKNTPEGLDAQNLTFGRDGDSRTVVVHHDCFQRPIAGQLTNAGFNTIEAAKDLHRALHTSSFPASD